LVWVKWGRRGAQLGWTAMGFQILSLAKLGGMRAPTVVTPPAPPLLPRPGQFEDKASPGPGPCGVALILPGGCRAGAINVANIENNSCLS
jgi:hypothetical protein